VTGNGKPPAHAGLVTVRFDIVDGGREVVANLHAGGEPIELARAKTEFLGPKLVDGDRADRWMHFILGLSTEYIREAAERAGGKLVAAWQGRGKDIPGP
jgi:hypothetical protein